jgi:hypothetical protein
MCSLQYPVIPGELFYMSIRNEEKLRELQEWQRGREGGRERERERERENIFKSTLYSDF